MKNIIENKKKPRSKQNYVEDEKFWGHILEHETR